MWMVARSCRQSFPKTSNGTRGGNGQIIHTVWINFLCETTSFTTEPCELPLHHDLASMRQAFRVRGRSRCLEAKMWIRGDTWKGPTLWSPRNIARLNEILRDHGWQIIPGTRHYFMFGAGIASIVPWQVFITSREFNLNFSWKEGFWPKESTHALKREPNWRNKKMEPRRRPIGHVSFEADNLEEMAEVPLKDWKKLPLFFDHIN